MDEKSPVIAIVCTGSAGDVLPFIPVGQALSAKGATVVIVTHPGHKARIEGKGLKWADVGPDPVEERAKSGQAEGPNGVDLKSFMQPLIATWAEQALGACQTHNVNYVVFPGCSLSSCSIAEVLRVPFCIAYLAPFAKTNHHAPPLGYGTGQVWFGWAAAFRWWSWEDSSFALFRDTINKFRVAKGLNALIDSPLRTYWNNRVTHVMGYSRFLCPKPADVPSFVHVNGQWCEPDGKVPEIPGDIITFLEQETSPVILVALGSMMELVCKTSEEFNEMLTTIGRAVVEGGARVILSTRGCDKFKIDLPSSREMLVTAGLLPFAQLMPRCTGVICQAGSGTLHTALRAGSPVIVIPALPEETDQPFFAAVAVERGFALNPGYKGLAQIKTGGRLKRCVVDLLRKRFILAQRARELAEQMKTEGGAVEAAEVILGDFHSYQKHTSKWK